MAQLVEGGQEAADLERYGASLLPNRGTWGSAPYMTSSDALAYRSKDSLMSDARDAARTNPYGRSALRAQADAIIGTDFKLQYEPDFAALGVTPEEAAAYSAVVEGLWEQAANSPMYHLDAQRKQTFTGLMRTAYCNLFVSGEVLGTIEWKRAFNGDRTCLNLLDSERLSDPRGQQDYTGKRRMGVERDIHGAPVAYHIRESNPSDLMIWGPATNQFAWRKIPRYTPWGRLNVVHYFEQDRSDMTRGLTAYTTALLPMRLLQDYNTTELESAAIRATYAAVIQSELDYDQAMKVIGDQMSSAVKGNPVLDVSLRMMAERASYYKGQDFKFGKSKVAHLLPNEELKMVQGTPHASALKEFNAVNLYTLASALGVDYSTLTKDFSSTNYSGARAALFDVWRSYEVRRSHFIEGVPLPFFGAWLEEQIALRGTLPMLGKRSFYDVRDAICRATFQTWNKPRLDPLKENEADQVLYNMGALSLREICGNDGRDWRRVLQQRSAEKDEMKRLGLTPLDINPDLGTPAAAKDSGMPKPEGGG